MDTYSLLRHFADSWGLLALFAIFLGVGAWAFWPSLRHERDNAAEIPFRNDVAAEADHSGADRNAPAQKEPNHG